MDHRAIEYYTRKEGRVNQPSTDPKEILILAYNISMSVQGVSNDQVVQLLQSMEQRRNISQQIAISVIKQNQEMQKSQAVALVKMIHQSTPEGTGSIINLLA